MKFINLLLVAVSTAVVGCQTPLQQALKKNGSSNYQEMLPVSTDAQLGGRIVRSGILWWKSEKVASNDCFTAITSPGESSWKDFDLEYDSGADGDLKADFGGA